MGISQNVEKMKTGEMSQRLREFAAHAEVWILRSSAHMVAHYHIQLPFQGIQSSLGPLVVQAYMQRKKYMQNKYIMFF